MNKTKEQKRKNALVDEIIRQFPNMPIKEIVTCAEHSCEKGSGRIGRSPNCSLDKIAKIAVIAHIRHYHTDYDKIMRNSKIPSLKHRQQFARQQVNKQIAHIYKNFQKSFI
jgi:hypothetical protein